MKRLKATSLLLLIFAMVPSFADSKITSAPVPWPWPWAIECPIEWDQLAHDYNLTDLPDGNLLTISVSHTRASSYVGIHVRRQDVTGAIHSEGFAWVPKYRRNVVVYMTPQRDRVKSYALRFGVYLDHSDRFHSCHEDRLATVMSFEPAHCDRPHGTPDYNYVLDAASVPF